MAFQHRLAETPPPRASSPARPRSEFSRSLGLNVLTSVTPQPEPQTNGRPSFAPVATAPAVPVFWQARPRVWVTTDHEEAPFEDSEETRKEAAEVWRPVAYAGAAMKVYATEAVRKERRGLAPVAPSHPAAPVTVAEPDGSCYHTYYDVLPGESQPTYLLAFNLTGVPREVVRRAQVTLDGGSATVAAELTLRPRARDGSGKADLAATPTIWRLFGRCELPADAGAPCWPRISHKHTHHALPKLRYARSLCARLPCSIPPRRLPPSWVVTG